MKGFGLQFCLIFSYLTRTFQFRVESGFNNALVPKARYPINYLEESPRGRYEPYISNNRIDSPFIQTEITNTVDILDGMSNNAYLTSLISHSRNNELDPYHIELPDALSYPLPGAKPQIDKSLSGAEQSLSNLGLTSLSRLQDVNMNEIASGVVEISSQANNKHKKRANEMNQSASNQFLDVLGRGGVVSKLGKNLKTQGSPRGSTIQKSFNGNAQNLLDHQAAIGSSAITFSNSPRKPHTVRSAVGQQPVQPGGINTRQNQRQSTTQQVGHSPISTFNPRSSAGVQVADQVVSVQNSATSNIAGTQRSNGFIPPLTATSKSSPQSNIHTPLRNQVPKAELPVTALKRTIKPGSQPNTSQTTVSSNSNIRQTGGQRSASLSRGPTQNIKRQPSINNGNNAARPQETVNNRNRQPKINLSTSRSQIQTASNVPTRLLKRQQNPSTTRSNFNRANAANLASNQATGTLRTNAIQTASRGPGTINQQPNPVKDIAKPTSNPTTRGRGTNTIQTASRRPSTINKQPNPVKNVANPTRNPATRGRGTSVVQSASRRPNTINQQPNPVKNAAKPTSNPTTRGRGTNTIQTASRGQRTINQQPNPVKNIAKPTSNPTTRRRGTNTIQTASRGHRTINQQPNPVKNTAKPTNKPPTRGRGTNTITTSSRVQRTINQQPNPVRNAANPITKRNPSTGGLRTNIPQTGSQRPGHIHHQANPATKVTKLSSNQANGGRRANTIRNGSRRSSLRQQKQNPTVNVPVTDKRLNSVHNKATNSQRTAGGKVSFIQNLQSTRPKQAAQNSRQPLITRATNPTTSGTRSKLRNQRPKPSQSSQNIQTRQSKRKALTNSAWNTQPSKVRREPKRVQQTPPIPQALRHPMEFPQVAEKRKLTTMLRKGTRQLNTKPTGLFGISSIKNLTKTIFGKFAPEKQNKNFMRQRQAFRNNVDFQLPRLPSRAVINPAVPSVSSAVIQPSNQPGVSPSILGSLSKTPGLSPQTTSGGPQQNIAAGVTPTSSTVLTPPTSGSQTTGQNTANVVSSQSQAVPPSATISKNTVPPSVTSGNPASIPITPPSNNPTNQLAAGQSTGIQNTLSQAVSRSTIPSTGTASNIVPATPVVSVQASQTGAPLSTNTQAGATLSGTQALPNSGPNTIPPLTKRVSLAKVPKANGAQAVPPSATISKNTVPPSVTFGNPASIPIIPPSNTPTNQLAPGQSTGIQNTLSQAVSGSTIPSTGTTSNIVPATLAVSAQAPQTVIPVLTKIQAGAALSGTQASANSGPNTILPLVSLTRTSKAIGAQVGSLTKQPTQTTAQAPISNAVQVLSPGQNIANIPTASQNSIGVGNGQVGAQTPNSVSVKTPTIGLASSTNQLGTAGTKPALPQSVLDSIGSMISQLQIGTQPIISAIHQKQGTTNPATRVPSTTGVPSPGTHSPGGSVLTNTGAVQGIGSQSGIATPPASNSNLPTGVTTPVVSGLNNGLTGINQIATDLTQPNLQGTMVPTSTGTIASQTPQGLPTNSRPVPVQKLTNQHKPRIGTTPRQNRHMSWQPFMTSSVSTPTQDYSSNTGSRPTAGRQASRTLSNPVLNLSKNPSQPSVNRIDYPPKGQPQTHSVTLNNQGSIGTKNNPSNSRIRMSNPNASPNSQTLASQNIKPSPNIRVPQTTSFVEPKPSLSTGSRSISHKSQSKSAYPISELPGRLRSDAFFSVEKGVVENKNLRSFLLQNIIDGASRSIHDGIGLAGNQDQLYNPSSSNGIIGNSPGSRHFRPTNQRSRSSDPRRQQNTQQSDLNRSNAIVTRNHPENMNFVNFFNPLSPTIRNVRVTQAFF